MGTGHRVAIVLTPLVAIATLAVGMRVGARRHGARGGRLRRAARARGRRAFAWQVVTLVEDDGDARDRGADAASPCTRARNGLRGAPGAATRTRTASAKCGSTLPGVERGERDRSRGGRRRGRASRSRRGASPGTTRRGWRRRRGRSCARRSATGRSRSTSRSSAGKLVARSDVRSSFAPRRATTGTRSRTSPSRRSRSRGSTCGSRRATTCALGWARLDVSPQDLRRRARRSTRSTPDGRDGRVVRRAAGGDRVRFSRCVPDVAKGDGAGSSTCARVGADGRTPRWTTTRGARSAAGRSCRDASGRALARVRPAAALAGAQVARHARASRAAPSSSTRRRSRVRSSSPGTPMPAGLAAERRPVRRRAPTSRSTPRGASTARPCSTGSSRARNERRAPEARALRSASASLAVASRARAVLLLQAARRGRRLAPDAIDGIEESAALVKRRAWGAWRHRCSCALLGFGLLAAILLLQS